MLPPRSINVPEEFAGSLAGVSHEHLAGLARSVRTQLDRGASEEQVVGSLTGSGWEPSFSRWYVRESARTSEEVLLVAPTYADYPRFDPNAVSAEDLRIAATAYRWVNMAGALFFLGIIAAFALGATFASTPGAMPPTILLIYGTQIAALVLAIVAAVQATRPLKTSPTLSIILGILVIFIPCGFILYLLILSGRLNSLFNRAGVSVKLLGPRKSELEAAIATRERQGY